MHRPLLLMASLVLGIASIAVTFGSTSLERPAASGEPASNSKEVVLRYYDAVNDMIATGDPAHLREVVHPEMIDIDPLPTGPGGLAGIESHLANLHATVPGARLEPGPIIGEGAQVFAQVTVTSNDSSFPLGFWLDSPSVLWPSSEVFLVSSGQIIERRFHWDGQVSINQSSAFPPALDMLEQRSLEVALIEFHGIANHRFSTTELPAIFRLLSGSITISLSRSAAKPALVDLPVWENGTETHVSVYPGHSYTLSVGDVLVVSPGSTYSLRNLKTQPASLLGVATAIPPPDGSRSDTADLFPEPAITVRSLVAVSPVELKGPAQLSMGSVSLMPGGRLTVDPSSILMVIWTERGEPSTIPGRSGCVEAALAGSPQPGDENQLANLHLLCSSGTIDNAVFNPGTEPATAWVVSVTPMPLAS